MADLEEEDWTSDVRLALLQEQQPKVRAVVDDGIAAATEPAD